MPENSLPDIATPDIVAYDDDRASWYRRHHEKNWRTRLSTARERALASRALGRLASTESLLDVACGTGRFWPVVDRRADHVIALDNSQSMLREAIAFGAPNPRRRAVCGSAFALPFADGAFDAVLCMRFLHHLAHRVDRVAALTELRRVARSGVVVSLWVDGSREAKRRLARQREAERPRGFGRRVCVERTEIERDFAAAGFGDWVAFDFAPRLSMWRIYALHCGA